MTVDLYTKSVLTVIAACLLWLVLGGSGFLPAAAVHAQPQATRVLLTGWVDFTGREHQISYSGAANAHAGALPVVVVNNKQ